MNQKTRLEDVFVPSKTPGKPAVIHEKWRQGSYASSTYSEIEDVARNIANVINEYDRNKKSLIVGVGCYQNCVYPSVILGILKSGKAFYNLDLQDPCGDTSLVVKILGIQCFIVESEWLFANSNWEAKFFCSIASQVVEIERPKKVKRYSSLYLVSLKHSTHICILDFPLDVAYVVKTSGTTAHGSNRRFVLVTHSAIVPNITAFAGEIWKISSVDVVLGLSPTTFDPSIVDLFSCFFGNATIVYCSDQLKLNPHAISNIFITHSVSIVQITPTLFQHLSSNGGLKDVFGSSKSSLRVLCFGGEKCLSKDKIGSVIEKNMLSRLSGIFNLYGITEVSCWASSCRVELDGRATEDDSNVWAQQCGLVDFLVPDTQLILKIPAARSYEYLVIPAKSENCQLCNVIEGEILIGTKSRKCVVLNEDGSIVPSLKVEVRSTEVIRDYECRATGDWASYDPESKSLYYAYRTDKVLKFYGIKFHLGQLEMIGMETGMLKSCHSELYHEEIYLFIVFSDGLYEDVVLESPEMAEELLLQKFIVAIGSQLTLLFMPQKIIILDSLPFTENGKFDVKIALQKAASQQTKLSIPSNIPIVFRKDLTMDMVKDIWNAYSRRGNREIAGFENFIQAGGNSRSALLLSERIFSILRCRGSNIHRKYEQNIVAVLCTGTFDQLSHIIHTVVLESFKINQPKLIDFIHSKNKKSLIQIKNNATQSNEIEALNFQSDIISAGESVRIEMPWTDESYLKRENEKKHVSFPILKWPFKALYQLFFDLEQCVDATASIMHVPETPETEGKRKNIGPNSMAIVGSHSGLLIAVYLNAKQSHETGNRIVWQRKFNSAIECGACVEESALVMYIGCHDCKLHKICCITGRTICFYVSEAPFRSSPSTNLPLDGESKKVACLDDNRNLCILKATDLTLIWKRREKVVLTQISPWFTKKAVFTSSKSEIFGYSSDNGDAIISFPINNCGPMRILYSPGSYSSESRLYTNEYLIHFCKKTNSVRCLDVYTFEQVWSHNLEGIFSEVILLMHDCPLNSNKKEVIVIDVSANALQRLNINDGLLKGYMKLDLELKCLKISQTSVMCSKTTEDGRTCFIAFVSDSGKNRLYITFVDFCKTPSAIGGIFLNCEGDLESFSKIVFSQNHILISGRDNRLHIVSLDYVNNRGKQMNSFS